MYLAYLTQATTPKNKLEEDFFLYLKALDRTLVSDQEIENFTQEILDDYARLCNQHHRCKPIENRFFRGLNKDDYILAGSNAEFKLLKSK